MGLAFLITNENLQLMSERKVLKEDEYKSLLDAGAVIDAARHEARRIVRTMAQRVDESRLKGYEEGVAQGRAEYAQRLMSDALETERQLQAMRKSMAGIVVKAVTQMLGSVDPQALLEAALLKIDELIRSEPLVTIWVAPANEGVLRAALERLRTEVNWTLNISVQSSSEMPRNGCLVQTASGTVEIGLDAQIAAIRKAVERKLGTGNG
jgi:type III secretion protein L